MCCQEGIEGDMSMEPLLDCPFCGKPTRWLEDAMKVKCPQCGIQTQTCETKRQATDIWNARVPPEPMGLKPCPFCSNEYPRLETVREDTDDYSAVVCSECGARTTGQGTDSAAIMRWNRRPV